MILLSHQSILIEKQLIFAGMIALIVLVVFSAIGIGALVHAVRNAPYAREHEDCTFKE